MTIKILFSDIDGTCVHYPDGRPFNLSDIKDDGSYELSEDGRNAAVLRLPPSSSGSVGIISLKTFELYAAIRALGIKLILITGARVTTLLQRLPYLPRCDALCCESGGRIYYPTSSIATAAPLVEDIQWRKMHEAVTGPANQDNVPPYERKGALWEYFSTLQHHGAILDASSYTTAFRVKNLDKIQSYLIKHLPDSLSTAMNLGAADVYPKTTGKANVARYMMSRFGAAMDGSEAVFMCDDDNDIELALAVKKAYLPSITASTLAAVVESSPDRFHVSKEKRVWATEDILQTILLTECGVANAN